MINFLCYYGEINTIQKFFLFLNYHFLFLRRTILTIIAIIIVSFEKESLWILKKLRAAFILFILLIHFFSLAAITIILLTMIVITAAIVINMDFVYRNFIDNSSVARSLISIVLIKKMEINIFSLLYLSIVQIMN